MNKFRSFIRNRFLVALVVAFVGVFSMLFNSPFVNVFILIFTGAIYTLLVGGFVSNPNKVEKAFHDKMKNYLPSDMQDEF